MSERETRKYFEKSILLLLNIIVGNGLTETGIKILRAVGKYFRNGESSNTELYNNAKDTESSGSFLTRAAVGT
ncbi:hypothetical protein BOTNAR_0017g00210 [Botryotinia narcissicola]|uniref:Uncharacterized protein n=1 Tax=Botryotinia narcissicola TaxID=278944 RepID=A0A4Z1J5S5_9HELO|nr:hypothetical protein BOTNAR_0017g00210 [Botryotinia narcissicola]